MKQEIQLSVTPEQATSEEAIRVLIRSGLQDKLKEPWNFRITRRSIDARKSRILINLKIEIYPGAHPPENIFSTHIFHKADINHPVVIIGSGPAGLFAALRLLESGIQPIIIERGKMIRDRRRDLAALNKHHIVNPDSNYCFGEGGAGTYSDGKLYTRSTKRGDVQKVLELFVQHGAGEEILTDAHPHIGTNKLPQIIENIRQTILNHGGIFHFETRLKDISVSDSRIRSIVTESTMDNTVNEFICDKLILATGHSARDIFLLLAKKNILIEAKPFAMGVRVEHPQELIDSIQYHYHNSAELAAVRKFLPPSSYSLVHQVNGRGVYSFCMCPGGIIAPCATASEEVVVNGWSPSKRNNPYANSGIVAGIEKEDLIPFASFGKFAGLHYQQTVERMAWEAGGKTQAAPAQRLTDFINNRFSSTLPQSSYQPGITPAALHELLPANISLPLQSAFRAFEKKMRGYMTNEAVIHGVESRTSSPVRIPRDQESLEHPQVQGLFPVGEGAGYAGGIVSAAIDGQRVAEKISEKILT